MTNNKTVNSEVWIIHMPYKMIKLYLEGNEEVLEDLNQESGLPRFIFIQINLVALYVWI